MYNWLRDTLLSWGSFSYSMSLTFLEGVLKCPETLSNRYCASWIFYPVISLRGLFSCCWVFECLIARLLALLSRGSWLSLSLPITKRAPNLFGGTALHHHGESSPFLIRLMMSKVSTDCLFVSKGSELSWRFSKFLGWTALQLQVTTREVFTFPSVFLIS